MGALAILQLILNLAPVGLTLTQDIINIVRNVDTAINAAPGSAEHSAAIQAIHNSPMVVPK